MVINSGHQTSLRDVSKVLKVLSGGFQPGKLTMYGIFRDEMFFCAAFFDHYRKLGVEQFVIIDDKSIDGTREFLIQQDDCVTLDAGFRYGDEIEFLDFNGKPCRNRAGIYFKIALPHAFEPDRFTMYCDADEFLVLPPGVESIEEVISRLGKGGYSAASASVVEFFPASLDDLGRPVHAVCFDDLISAYPYFDALPLIKPGGRRNVTFLNQSASSRLFDKYDVRSPAKGLRGFFGAKSPARHTPRHKTPLVYASSDSYLVNTHDTNLPPADDLMLTLAHFVFTAQVFDKVERARKWRSYSKNSDKYDHYAVLLHRMRARGGQFLGPCSLKYHDPSQLLSCGLMTW